MIACISLHTKKTFSFFTIFFYQREKFKSLAGTRILKLSLNRHVKNKKNNVLYIFSIFSSRGFAPPNIVDDWDVSANAFTGAVTVLGCSFNFGRPEVSEKKINKKISKPIKMRKYEYFTMRINKLIFYPFGLKHWDEIRN